MSEVSRLNDRFGDYSVRVSRDDRNYILVKHGVSEKSGECTEKEVGYFNSLESCLRELASRESNYSVAISDWLLRFRDILEELRRAF